MLLSFPDKHFVLNSAKLLVMIKDFQLVIQHVLLIVKIPKIAFFAINLLLYV